MRYMSLILISVSLLASWTLAQTNEEKNVTIITTQSSADGKSQIAKELLEECIVKLPNVKSLEALIETESKFLRDINGKKNDNRHLKVFSATISINYLVRQKEMIIITTNSVTGQEPVVKEVERTVPKSVTIQSDPDEGDLYASGQSRDYYFSTPEKAEENAKKRARIWIKQHETQVCP